MTQEQITSIICETVVAVAIIAGDIALHWFNRTVDGFDSAVAIIVTFYFGSRIVSKVKGARLHIEPSEGTTEMHSSGPADSTRTTVTTEHIEPPAQSSAPSEVA